MNPTIRHPQSVLRRRRRRARGFTLIEAALTTVIIGTGVLAIVAAQQAYHAKNQWAVRTGTAMLLANELRELTMALPAFDPLDGSIEPRATETSVKLYNDLCDFAGEVDETGVGSGRSFSAADDTGPINALREVIPDMEGWRQHVKVDAVLPSNISSGYTQGLGTEPAVYRVTVDVYHQGPNDASESLISSLTWIVRPK